MGFADKVNAKSYDGKCIGCTKALQDNHGKSKEDLEVIKTQVAADTQKAAAINSIVLTTETAPNLNITKRIEIVTAECAFGMNIFKDLFAGVRDIVGGRSEAVQKTMRDSRKTALYELKKEAYEVGANAVVGVDLDYVELSNAGSMVMLVASGTAVVIEGSV
jgi:uncharacterized protein YbjQ (UPF0145 family)